MQTNRGGKLSTRQSTEPIMQKQAKKEILPCRNKESRKTGGLDLYEDLLDGPLGGG